MEATQGRIVRSLISIKSESENYFTLYFILQTFLYLQTVLIGILEYKGRIKSLFYMESKDKIKIRYKFSKSGEGRVWN